MFSLCGAGEVARPAVAALYLPRKQHDENKEDEIGNNEHARNRQKREPNAMKIDGIPAQDCELNHALWLMNSDGR